MTIRLGAHAQSANPLDDARQLGTNVLQCYLADPKGWQKPAFAVDGFRAAAEAEDIHVYVHSPFVINVASTNNRVRIPSRKLLQQHVDEAARIGAKGVIVHGGHVTAADDPSVGFDNWRKCVDGLDLPVPILIENTAGGRYAMTRLLESLERLWASIAGSDNASNVGFCLDTCHAHAAGLELATVVEQVRAITGRIDLIHLNDSKNPAGSGADHHENLGQGMADPDGLAAVVRAASAPVVLETPGGPEAHARDLEWLRARL